MNNTLERRPTTCPKMVVIFSAGVGIHPRGRVVDAAAFGDGDNVERLVAIRAIRPATAFEATQTQVTIKDDDDVHNIKTYEEQQRRDREEINRLNNLISEKNREIEGLHVTLDSIRPDPDAVPPEKHPLVRELIGQKDRVIDGLRTDLANALRNANSAGAVATGIVPSATEPTTPTGGKTNRGR